MKLDSTKPVVANLVRSFLFGTGSWIYTQLVNQRQYTPIVLTSHLENEDQFPFDQVFLYRAPFGNKHLWQYRANKLYELLTNKRREFFVSTIHDKKVKLLHAHFGTEAYEQITLQAYLQLPLVTTFYGADMSKLPRSRPWWKKRYQRLFAAGTLFFAEGPYMAQRVVDLGCLESKVRVQRLGVDLSKISYIPRYRLDNEPVRILMVNRFQEKKGIPYGIEAFASAVRRCPDIELRIIGGVRTKAEKKLFEQCYMIARRENVLGKVKFLGALPYTEYLQEMQAAHVLLAPSVTASDGDTEGGSPVSITEATAAGMPVISTWHCDIPEVVLHEATGLLVPERNTKALSEAICELATTQSSWEILGKRGRTHIETYFNCRLQAEQLETYYDDALAM